MHTEVALPDDDNPSRVNLSKAGFERRRAARQDQSASPFRPAVRTENPRCKLILWGPTGTYKTRTALRFPSPAVIDLERSAEVYKDEFNFSELPAPTWDEAKAAVRWLRDNRHEYRTLVVDPVTQLWSMCQRHWSEIFLERLKGIGRKQHHHEFYDFGPKEWSTCKADFNEFLRSMLQLDMSLVVTCHDKAEYAGGSGDMMKKVGELPDVEKNFQRPFDIVIRCSRLVGKEGLEFWGDVEKDRTNKLGNRFRLDVGGYERIANAVGLEAISSPATPREACTPEQLILLRQLIHSLNVSDAYLTERLLSYGAARLDDLTRVQADQIITKMEKARDRRVERQQQDPAA